MVAFNNRYKETKIVGIPVFAIFLMVIVCFLFIGIGLLIIQKQYFESALLGVVNICLLYVTYFYMWLGDMRYWIAHWFTSRMLRSSDLGDEW
ncbi:MAG: hypothetical protein QM538_02555 [Methylacidiphilales bacterium]|nr:hypothetical protein [Candidatus Methylacidiphilales bacterium]